MGSGAPPSSSVPPPSSRAVEAGDPPEPTGADVGPEVGPEVGPDRDADVGVSGDGARPGDLTPSWRILLALVWTAVIFAFAAVWQASVQIGIGTWWLGPRSQPAPVVIRLAPFLVATAVLAAIAYDLRRVVSIGVAAAATIVVGSLFDLQRSVGLGLTELTIGLAAGLATLVASTGRYRVAR